MAKHIGMQTRYGTRRSVKIAARYWEGRGIAREVVISDLSPKGCRMQDRFSSLKVGSRIDLQIGSGSPVKAEVRWQERGGIVGVEFLRPLDPRCLQDGETG